MSRSRLNPFFGNWTYIFIAGLASIPLFLILNVVTRALQLPEDEAAATGFTIMVVGGVFIGRYLGGIWAYRMKGISSRLFIALSLLATGLLVWVFFYTEFPLQRRPSINTMLFALPLFVLSIITGIIIKFIRSISQKQVQEARASAAHSASELQLLQSQISPHFLFNTLNNLYGLSITKHERIPPLLLKLSELLRYSVYDANKAFVPVKDEIAYIKNYIEFEKIRIGDRLALTVDIDDMIEGGIMIAPMLLIVFIENAFKHSKNSTDQSIFIHISLKTWGNRLLFSVVNSYNSEIKSTSDGYNGLGLVNVRKRLDLLYPDQHYLVIEDSDETYKVMLQLKMM